MVQLDPEGAINYVGDCAFHHVVRVLTGYDLRMATRTVIELIDDLDGSKAAETLRFALDGTDYEIDLAEENADELRAHLARFVDAGRKTNVTKRASSVRRLAPAADTKAVRAWAAENGIEVNSRGRIKDDVVQRYLGSLS